MADPETRGVYGRPFTEQVAFFRRKLGNLVPTERWDDMLREAHDSGFMVAGATSADLLTDFAAAVDKAIVEGKGIEAFRKDFRAIVRRNGWTGWAGEGSTKGEAWRLGVIYRTNMATSYSAGRFAQLKAGNFPFWVYRHGGSREPRPEHLSWDGLALPPDHPFWSTRYPPSDWGCSCYVVGARSAAAVKRLGGDLSKKLPANWDHTDPKTGAPIGVGRGWDYAPGASVSHLVNAIAQRVRHWDYAIAKAFMDKLPASAADNISEAYRALPSTADDARRYAQRVLEPPPIDREPGALGPPPARTLGLVRSDQARQIKDLTGSDVERYDFSIDAYAIKHVRTRHGIPKAERDRGQREVTAADYGLLPQLISEADQIEAADESRSTGRRLVRLVWDRGFERWEAVMEIRDARRSLALTTLFIRETRRP
jgi:hypothetical protein